MEDFFIERYPKSSNNSLRAFSAADELMVRYVGEQHIEGKDVLLLNDRFGFLNLSMMDRNCTHVISYRSQEKAILKNLNRNNIDVSNLKTIDLLDFSYNHNFDFALLHLPKSLELFELFLARLTRAIAPNGICLCGFMTRHFTASMLKIASKYFETVEQTKAWKKARLLILKNAKHQELPHFINEIKREGKKPLRQYYGVFSSRGIDIATRFLLEQMQLPEPSSSILDLASGNGVIAVHIREKMPNAVLHLLDDSYLAVASSKMNLGGRNTFFYVDNNLDQIRDASMDMIVTNPPFHFEHEIDISVAVDLFRQCKSKLKPNGFLQVVANQHLNYSTHLRKIFTRVRILKAHKKFVIYIAD